MTMVEPFTLNTSPVFAELMAGTLDERAQAYADPAWRQRVRDAWASADRAAAAAVGHLRDHGVDGASRAASAAACSTIADERGADPFDALLDLAVAEPDAAGHPGQGRRRQRRRGRRRASLLQEDGCTLGLSDAGAHVGQLCDAPLATDLLGNWVREQGRADASSRPSTS